MGCRSSGVAGALMFGLLAVARIAAADPITVRMVSANDLAALPLIVAKHNHLIEKQAQARGLGEVTVEWLVPAPASRSTSW